MSEEKSKEDAGTSKDAGVQSEADKKIAELNAETERLNKAIAENENAKARARLGGVSDAGQAKPTDEETKKVEAQKAADEIVKAFR